MDANRGSTDSGTGWVGRSTDVGMGVGVGALGVGAGALGVGVGAGALGASVSAAWGAFRSRVEGFVVVVVVIGFSL
jgi:hypothetical protein